MVRAAVEQELHDQLDRLPPGQQQQVLDFARALAASGARGVPGTNLLPFAGSITAEDLEIMTNIIDSDCEQVNHDEW